MAKGVVVFDTGRTWDAAAEAASFVGPAGTVILSPGAEDMAPDLFPGRGVQTGSSMKLSPRILSPDRSTWCSKQLSFDNVGDPILRISGALGQGLWLRRSLGRVAGRGVPPRASQDDGRADRPYGADGRAGEDPSWGNVILVIGTTPFGTDLANSGILALQNSYTPPVLPTGRVLYATLLTQSDGSGTATRRSPSS